MEVPSEGTVLTPRAGQCESPVGAIATLRFKAPTADRTGTTCRYLSYSAWVLIRLKITNLALILRVDGAFFSHVTLSTGIAQWCEDAEVI